MDLRLRVTGALLLSVAMSAPASAAKGEDTDLPADFRQIIPRGRIASVDHPVFVPAAEAEISDDAWVLGVEIDGQAKAYSLNLLNQHEIINDRFGEKPVAAVW
jgi:carotenoid cleavage dioxygenase-like enzyme